MPASDDGPTPGIPPPSPDHSFGLVLLVSGAIAFSAAGQYLFTRGRETWMAGALLAGGAGLFLVARRVATRRAYPAWWTALRERGRISPERLLLAALSLICAYLAHSLAGDGPMMARPAAALGAWTAGLALAAAATVQPDSPQALGRPWTRREILGVFGLTALAFALRVTANGDVPAALSGDEGSAGLIAVEIAEGRFNNPFTLGWYSFPSLYFMIPALTVRALGHGYAALRLPSAIAGALTVAGLYWFARPMAGRVAAGLSAMLLTAMGLHIHFSRIGLNNVWDALFAVLTLGAFWRGWESGRRRDFILAGLWLGLSQYFYTSARMLPVLLAAWLALHGLAHRGRLRERAGDVAALGLVALVVFLPLGLFYLDHPDEFMAPMNRFSILAGNWLDVTARATGLTPFQLILGNFRQAALGFTSVPLRSWYASGQPMLEPLAAGLFSLGLALLAAHWREPRAWLIGLWLAGVMCIGALTESTPAGQRYLIGTPAAAFVAAWPLAVMSGWIRDAWPNGRGVVRAAVAAVLIGSMAVELRGYFWDFAPTAGRGDANTQVAGTLGRVLSEYPEGGQAFFFGAPRMGYDGFATLRFLAPHVQGEDVTQPLDGPPAFEVTGPHAAFAFLPERSQELSFVVEGYPGGATRWFYDHEGRPLFVLYESTRE